MLHVSRCFWKLANTARRIISTIPCAASSSIIYKAYSELRLQSDDCQISSIIFLCMLNEFYVNEKVCYICMTSFTVYEGCLKIEFKEYNSYSILIFPPTSYLKSCVWWNFLDKDIFITKQNNYHGKVNIV